MILFHGSPGSEKDFSLIQNELAQEKEINSVVIGYSLGSLKAIQYATRNAASVKALILIAPYVYPQKNSALLSGLLRTPLLGIALLKIVGTKSIQKFIAKSSYPDEAPSEYKNELADLSNSNLLKKALLEKDTIAMPCESELQEIEKSKIPILVIWGEEDQTSSYKEQVETLLKTFPSIRLQKIPHAGHALVWTRAKEVSNLIKGFIHEHINA